MSSRTTIEIRGLSKRFGAVEAVTALTFTVEPGSVTGFLGPNGAGKTTTLRMLLGLVRPTAGTATFGGANYHDLDRPLATVGTALEAASFHPGRTAHNHLDIYATAAEIPRSRVGAVLEQVGLGAYSDRRVGTYSLGMRQRLGLALALLGDPGILVLDEPVNGLDPEGIRWIRTFMRELAAEGRTVLVSSHLLSEVQQSVDRLVVISKGRLVYEGGLSGLTTKTRVIADSPERGRLESALLAAGADIQKATAGVIISERTAVEVGAIAHRAGVALSLLQTEQGGLEQAFLDLVGEGSAP